jgi:hypothetical protein
MTNRDKQLAGAFLFTILLAAVVFLLESDPSFLADGCPPCDCSHAVVALPLPATAVSQEAK